MDTTLKLAIAGFVSLGLLGLSAAFEAANDRPNGLAENGAIGLDGEAGAGRIGQTTYKELWDDIETGTFNLPSQTFNACVDAEGMVRWYAGDRTGVCPEGMSFMSGDAFDR